MSTFKLKASRQLLALAMGFAISASALAAVTSAPTGTVMGRAPVLAAPTMGYTNADSNGLVNEGDTLNAVIQPGDFSDDDGDALSGYTYSWKADGAAVGTDAASLAITAAEKGKKITLSVKAHTDASITEPSDGLAVAGVGGAADVDGDGEIDVAADNALVSVAVSGYVSGTTPEVDSTLTATPACLTACGTVRLEVPSVGAVQQRRGSWAPVRSAVAGLG